MINTIIEEAKKIARESKMVPLSQKEKYLQKAQDILINYLHDHQHDTQAWLLLTRIECNSPFYDPERIMDYVNHILLYDPINPYAFLFWSYADYYLMGNLDEDFYTKLCTIHNKDPKIMSMFELAKARFLCLKDFTKYEEALKKSIKYAPEFVINYCDLGRFYIEQGRIKEGVHLIRRGLENIAVIVAGSSSLLKSDPSSIEQLIEEFFVGKIMSIVVYEELQMLLRKNDIKSNDYYPEE